MDVEIHFCKIPVPSDRFTPLKKSWLEISTCIKEDMRIDVHMNLQDHCVELQTRLDTPDPRNLDRSAAFVQAFIDEFNVYDAMAILRNHDMHVESFNIDDVENLCVERVHAIENATMTRIVIRRGKETKVLGFSANVKIARDSLCGLIDLGVVPRHRVADVDT